MKIGEALKLCIDGETVRPVGTMEDMCFKNNWFFYKGKLSMTAIESTFVDYLIDNRNAEWEVVKPEPEFKVGDVVVCLYSCRIFVVRSIGYCNNAYDYCCSQQTIGGDYQHFTKDGLVLYKAK